MPVLRDLALRYQGRLPVRTLPPVFLETLRSFLADQASAERLHVGVQQYEATLLTQIPTDYFYTPLAQCGCGDPGARPPCSWCTNPANNPDAEDS